MLHIVSIYQSAIMIEGGLAFCCLATKHYFTGESYESYDILAVVVAVPWRESSQLRGLCSFNSHVNVKKRLRTETSSTNDLCQLRQDIDPPAMWSIPVEISSMSGGAGMLHLRELRVLR